MNFSFDGNTTLVLLGGIVLLTVGIILYFKYRFSHYDWHRLKAKHALDQGRKLLVGRSKFPEVDVFRYSSQFMRFGLLASLFVILAALNWTTYEEETAIPENALVMDEDITLEVPRSSCGAASPPSGSVSCARLRSSCMSPCRSISSCRSPTIRCDAGPSCIRRVPTPW